MSDPLVREIGRMDKPCRYPHESADVTGMYCELPEGHAGDHEAATVVRWPDWGWRDD